MTKQTTIRNYPKDSIVQFQQTKKSLIRLEQNKAPIMFFAANSISPTNEQKEIINENEKPFIGEIDIPSEGELYPVFEICTLQCDPSTGQIDMEALISFPKKCEQISLYADIINQKEEKVITSFSSETKKNSSYFTYEVHEKSLPNNKDYTDYVIIVHADWKNENNIDHSIALMRKLTKSDIGITYTHYHPQKQEHYKTFPVGSEETNRIFKAPNIKGLVNGKVPNDTINIALFRLPDDRSDLDYYCNFGKSGEKPILCIPGKGRFSLNSDTCIFDINNPNMPVKAYCAIRLLDKVGGAYVVATGRNIQFSTDSNHSIEIMSSEKTISYEMLKPWKQPFSLSGEWASYHFAYEFIIDIPIKSGISQETQYMTFVISSLKDTSDPFCVCKVKNITIKWGCFRGDTKILMEDNSIKQIREIKIGDTIRKNENEIVKVSNVWSGKEESYITIKTNTEEISVTNDHPLLTKKGWKRACALSIGEQLLKYDRTYTSIIGIKKIEDNIDVYNLSLEEEGSYTYLIANGIVAGSFETQNNPDICK